MEICPHQPPHLDSATKELDTWLERKQRDPKNVPCIHHNPLPNTLCFVNKTVRSSIGPFFPPYSHKSTNNQSQIHPVFPLESLPFCPLPFQSHHCNLSYSDTPNEILIRGLLTLTTLQSLLPFPKRTCSLATQNSSTPAHYLLDKVHKPRPGS